MATRAPSKKHVVVHTTTIDVKVVRIDKKQMTLSIFRQSDESPLINHDGTPNGTPWGRVNYRWADQEKGGVAFWVVWSADGRLYRDSVPKSMTRDTWGDWVAFADKGVEGDYYHAGVLNDVLSECENWIKSLRTNRGRVASETYWWEHLPGGFGGEGSHVQLEEPVRWVEWANKAWTIFGADTYGQEVVYKSQHAIAETAVKLGVSPEEVEGFESWEQAIEAMLKKGYNLTRQTALDEIDRLIADKETERDNAATSIERLDHCRRAVYATTSSLHDLDQLFIAV